MRTYPLALSLWTEPIGLWTRGGIANSLQNRGLSCVCSSDNEHSEFDIAGDSGEELLCGHSTNVCKMGNSVRGRNTRENLGIAAAVWNLLCTLVCGCGSGYKYHLIVNITNPHTPSRLKPKLGRDAYSAVTLYSVTDSNGRRDRPRSCYPIILDCITGTVSTRNKPK